MSDHMETGPEALPGNGPLYSVEALCPMADSPLAGRPVFFLGSSVMDGAASLKQSIPEYFAVRMSCRAIKETVGGTTLADDSPDSYIQRLLRYDAATPCELLICQLSTNDAGQRKPLGTIGESRDADSFDRRTITGAVEFIISYARRTWGCPVVFFTSARFWNGNTGWYDAMVKRLYQVREKWEPASWICGISPASTKFLRSCGRCI